MITFEPKEDSKEVKELKYHVKTWRLLAIIASILFTSTAASIMLRDSKASELSKQWTSYWIDVAIAVQDTSMAGGPTEKTLTSPDGKSAMVILGHYTGISGEEFWKMGCRYQDVPDIKEKSIAYVCEGGIRYLRLEVVNREKFPWTL